MAVLPTYAPQETVTSGGDTLRLNHTEDSGGLALAHLGSQIGQLGLQTAKADYAEAAAAAAAAKKAEGEGKKTAGLSDNLVRLDMETTWARKQADLQNNMDPTGKDYEKTVNEEFQKHVDSYKDKWSGQNKPQNDYLTAKFGAHVTMHAIDVETQTRKATQLAVTKDVITGAAVITAQNPAAFPSVMEDAKLKADTLNLGEKIRQPFLDNVRKQAEAGLVQYGIDNNPQAIVDAAKGAVAGFAKSDTPPVQAKVIGAAKTTGMDPSLMLGLVQIETGGKFNEDAVNPGGTRFGPYQTSGPTSAYGPHDPKDTTAAGIATGIFLAKRQQEMRAKGIDPLPGRTFMFHNVGEGVAWRLINEKDPTKTMGQILYDEYGDKPAKGGGFLRDAVGRNNPQLYNPNMTVAQVRESYETKMGAAMAATQRYIGTSGSNDEVARAALSKMTGVDIQQLGAADLANIAGLATDKLGKMKKADIQEQLAIDIIGNVTRMQPYNKEHREAVDKFVSTRMPEVADQLVSGGTKEAEDTSRAAFATVGGFVQKYNYLPQQWHGALRELVMNGDPKNAAKARAYATLDAMEKDNPTAYSAAGFQKDMTDRVKLFQQMTGRTNDPAQALQFIQTEFGQEHNETFQALKSVVDNHSTSHPGEVQQLKVSDITDALKKENSLWRKPAEPLDSLQEELMLRAYQQTYKEYRYAGRTKDGAQELAIADVTKSYGVSRAFVGKTEPAKFMQNPPDKFYAQPILGMKPFEDQAREVVAQEIARRYPADVKAMLEKRAQSRQQGTEAISWPSEYDAANINIQILPSVANGAKTNDEVRNGNPAPPYQVSYRDPRDGKQKIADEAWQPNLARMREEANTAQNTEKIGAANDRAKEQYAPHVLLRKGAKALYDTIAPDAAKLAAEGRENIR